MKKIISKSILFLLLLMMFTTTIYAGTYHRKLLYYRSGDQIKIAVTTTVLADIADQIGTDRVEAVSIIKGGENAQSPAVLRRMPGILKEADVVFIVGMGFDPWVRKTANSLSGDKAIAKKDFIDCSDGISSTGKTDDCLHYYWLDPVNGKKVGGTILAELIKIDPKHEGYYTENYRKFCSDMDAGMKKWSGELAPYHGAKIVGVSGDWSYLTSRLQLNLLGETCDHLSHIGAREIESCAKAYPDARLILFPSNELKIEKPLYNDMAAKYLALPVSVRDAEGTSSYFDLCEKEAELIARKLR